MMNNPYKNLNALDGNCYETTFASLLYIHPNLHPLSSNRFSQLTPEEQLKIKYTVGSSSENLQDIWGDVSCYVINYFENVLNIDYY